ncbi:hypothetical protein EJ06DRAFT_541738 [Trichodelitschia bisporula]|uniref:GPI transamidase component PIG-S n=1 Tax=Trichodelitschia bisporula TaxID=703511 RepID=A0A6G1I405_9PEZI|nr:hypothetical protein EJ06DRAFT_541738 [Trichodelitschia bisporula]
MPDAPEAKNAGESPNANAAHAYGAAKHPPPDSWENILTRRLVLFSFWAVILFLGLPIWWKTTTIYRAPLPLHQMQDWADGKVCRLTFPLRIAVEAPSLPSQEAQHLLRTTQHALDDLNDFSAHHLRLLLSERPQSGQPGLDQSTENLTVDGLQPKEDIALFIRLFPGESGTTPRADLHPYSPTLDIFYSSNQIPSSSSTVSPLATFIATELQAIFNEEQAALSYLLSSTSWHPSHTKLMSPELAETLSRRKTRSFKYAPTYHLTFSLFTPTAVPSDWEIEAALDEYMSPLLESLSSISNFTVDTQTQFYAGFSPSISGPEYNEEKQAWVLQKSDLGGFINAAEWPLSPSIGAGPTINFILYVPSEHQTPLLVADNGGSSWLIPQWGGVQILNINGADGSSVPGVLTKDDLRPAMQTFSYQLLSLLGLPQSPNSLPLRISTLTRVHSASLIFSASSTLGALARLTETLPSISIPKKVAQSVQQTTKHLQQACTSLREGRFHAALENARIAEAEAEHAFFEPSMVGQVYFPDEHKVAVYLPLLGTVSVPLVMAVVKEYRSYREARKRAS